MRFSGDPRTRRLVEIQELVDPLMGATPSEEINAHERSVLKWQSILHKQFHSLVLQAEQDDPSFLGMELNAIREDLTRRAKELAGIPAELDIASATREGEQAVKELESQAKLKGTVGGVQGILKIAGSVGAGLLSEAAAVALLTSVYGLAEENAKTIIEGVNSVGSETIEGLF
jgi:hypothetical protein